MIPKKKAGNLPREMKREPEIRFRVTTRRAGWSLATIVGSIEECRVPRKKGARCGLRRRW